MLNSKKESLSSIFLNNVVDSIFDAFTTTTSQTFNSSGLYTTDTIFTIDPLTTNGYPDYNKNYFWKFVEGYTCPTISVPSFPVSNFSLDENGTTRIEIAVTNYEEEDISIKREGLKLIVEGKKPKEEDETKRKYFYKNIAEREFKLDYLGSEKWDFDKLTAKMRKGKLTIEIPLKEEHKPIKKEFKINS